MELVPLLVEGGGGDVRCGGRMREELVEMAGAVDLDELD
jgi:hypothetical protein